MRWGSRSAAFCAAVVLVVGCGDDDDGLAGTEAGSDKAAAPEATVERFAVPDGLALGVDEFVAVGPTVVGFGPTNTGLNVVTSPDLGETWEPLVLPGSESPGFEYTSVEAGDDMAWVSGLVGLDDVSMTAEGAHLWLSRDGLDWTGGLLPTTQPPGTLVEPTVGLADDGTVVAGIVTQLGAERGDGVELFVATSAGDAWVPADMAEVAIDGAQTHIAAIWQIDDRLVAAVHSDSAQSPTVLESGDNGQSWEIGSCPEDSTVVNDDDECEPVTQRGSLRIGPRGVRVDGGDWKRPALEPPKASGRADAFGLENPVDLPDGGWLAPGGVYLNQEETFGVLVRSDDGATWQQLFPDDPCSADKLLPEFTTPVRLGDGWAVTHACREPSSGSISGDVAWSDLYVLDRAATKPVPVPDSRQDGREHLQPLVVGDVVLVPVVEVHEEETGSGFVEMVRLTP